MIPHIVRGDRMAGLMIYLAGPGRRNEHTEPRLVAGDAALLAWHDDNELDRDSALAIAKHLDRPRKALGVDVMMGVYERRVTGRDDAGKRVFKNVKVGEKQAHVWHCSLSLRPEEGRLTDEQWATIAGEFIRRMGFDDHEGTKAPCRWGAVHHGLSSKGNDHIHLAVNLVREDGTKASTHNDYHRVQQVARDLEREFDLLPLVPNEYETARAHTRAEWERSRRTDGRVPWDELTSDLQDAEVRKQFTSDQAWQRALAGRDRHGPADTAERAYDPAEREAQARGRARAKHERNRQHGGGAVPWDKLPTAEKQARISAELRADEPRHALARIVRGCSTAAADEAEFVRRMRRAGLLVRPRFADGRTDVVTGYSVAPRPQAGERPIWYGGGHLARDLTLPRLRQAWPDTPEAATAAVGEWNAAKRNRRPVRPGRETAEVDPRLWEQYATEVTALREQLRSVPIHDRDTWAYVASQTAGAFAAWSHCVETVPGPLAATADALAKSAQLRRQNVHPKTSGKASIGGVAMLLASATTAGQGATAQAAMLRQLVMLAQAVYAMHRASAEHHRAAQIRQVAEQRLREVADRLPPVPEPVPAGPTHDAPAAEAARIAATGQTPARSTGSPVPNRIEPARRHQLAGPDKHQGPER
ncbi:relaxase/mobilization nuclease domain-containing protein [Georgenia daeguensis]|uniref:MobA/VirD2-like nuclease domain-containing protein n=1 Tax=Georgenia daeguensis TaxID=908355 RepID=A0ABP8EZA1_9MICO